MELLKYIWTNKLNRAILTGIGLVVLFGFAIKLFFWDGLTLVPFLFFGLAIPLQILWMNSIPYTFHSEWKHLLENRSDKLEVRKDVKVYIKNFWPCAEMSKLKNTLRVMNMPYYDFDKADILESNDWLIIYGRYDQFFGMLKLSTRPFAINLAGKKAAGDKFYQVNFISLNETDEFKELTFTDDVIGTDNPITIRIYSDKT